jgi:hypothetical protein
MRFMVIVKATRDSEAGVMPGTELLTAMGKFNEEMAKAGVMEAGEGLHPTPRGARVKYSGGQPAVSRGPFKLSDDLVAGFWLIKTKSLDEAIDWMKRGGRFRRSADHRTARAGRASAGAGWQEVTAPSLFRGSPQG